MLPLSPTSREALHAHGVTDKLIAVALIMAECIEAAADDVANDTRAAAYDDATSRGGLLYRRARNRILRRFESEPLVSCDLTDNALHVRFGHTALSFYSAREGLEHPNVAGSNTKRRVVDESQLTLAVDDTPVIKRLVLMHESAPDGLVRIATGVLAGAQSWTWKVTLYDRYATQATSSDAEDRVAYDQLPEAELPELKPRKAGEGRSSDG
ncbi:MAG: hypothetical protein JWO02_3825 [Solirubrobacterales bacterium]|nr:hypothetical protein [Solirubrobacterales bacterium]